MKIILTSKEKLIEQILPINIEGNYWVKDYNENGEYKNLINIEADNGKWYMVSNYQVKIMKNEITEERVALEDGNEYTLVIENNEIAQIYCLQVPDKRMQIYDILTKDELVIGKGQTNDIINTSLNENVVIKFQSDQWTISNNKTTNKIYVNKKQIINKELNDGDIIFVNGTIITIFKDKLITNSTVVSQKLKNKNVEPRKILPFNNEDVEKNLGEEKKFYRSPRFRATIEPLEIKIDAPPTTQDNQKELPTILTIGPMLTMGLSSLMMSVNTITNMIAYKRPIWQGIPTIAISFAMFTSMVIWPIFTKKFQKKIKEQERKKLEKKYLGYLENQKNIIDKAIIDQSRILNENFIDLKECNNIILNQKSNLWERSIDQDDFLTIRLGLGQRNLIGKIEYPNESFSTSEDELRKAMENLKNNEPKLDKVPITVSLTEKNIVGILAGKEMKKKAINGLMLQLLTFHSYEFLKLVILTDKENEWENVQTILHCWNNIKTERYYATSLENGKEISLLLEKEYQDRKNTNKKDYSEHKPYYLIITDNYNLYRDLDIVKDVLNQENNLGFSMVSIAETLSQLPSECQTFVSIGQKSSGIIESELNQNNQTEFVSDFYENIDISKIYSTIANIPIEIQNSENMLPGLVSFLELYDSGKIEQLNIKNRWEESNSIVSLAAPVGVDKNGMTISLDLHEKYHGPHGLIAGMTGSGKSEFIITYVLSLAVNYSPEEVSFILIDYKGGGLAKVFEDKSNNRILPHVAGTITNLDNNEIGRALASIESELKRRQAIFNEARSKTGESTIDIYKYQRLYKEGKLEKPVSHLIIICDEFAELKSDQPEFMEQLISTARIGRSLGVHLILATQKPSGVVNDQIWSNSRFRVCLKVQDRSDSNEMIKCPDAATIKNVGRFYLQVGYNELFLLGQSAYCGTQYYPTEKIKKKVDNSVKIIDNVGNALVSIESKNDQNKEKSLGEELINVINHIISVAKENNIYAEKLWLEKLPEKIYTKDLKEIYNYQKEPYKVEVFVGEYDDPNSQRRGIVRVPITEGGNTVIYGNAENGRDLMLSTMILEMCMNYTTEELNMYICDMGGEVYGQYKKMPQIGDVAFINEEEKVNNLIKYVGREIDKRKKLFANYNGTYQNYIEKSGEKLPNIVVVINDYDAFSEVYEKLIETISSITRDSAKHGIAFIITANNGNSIRGRLRQNFTQNIVLRLNNKDSYMDFFGIRCRLEPANILGRGLMKEEGLYEYQTARVFEDETFNENLEKLSEVLISNSKEKAKPIPVLPEKILPEMLISNISTDGTPIAMDSSTTEIITYDFKKKITTNIVSKGFDNLKKLASGIIKILANDQTICLHVLDFQKSLNNSNNIKDYYTEEFDEAINNLNKINNYFKEQFENSKDENILSKYKHYIVVMLNASSIETSINEESKEIIKNIITESEKNKKMTFIMFDDCDKLVKLEYNEIFKKLVKKDQFIWYGPGINEQYSYKANLPFEETRRKVTESFGYIISKNQSSYVKFVEGEEDEQ